MYKYLHHILFDLLSKWESFKVDVVVATIFIVLSLLFMLVTSIYGDKK